MKTTRTVAQAVSAIISETDAYHERLTTRRTFLARVKAAVASTSGNDRALLGVWMRERCKDLRARNARMVGAP